MINNSTWQVATLKESHMVAINIKSLTFSIPDQLSFMAGQHYDIRLTAPNGYQAQRSYSLASPPEQTESIEFGVQILEGGEVSPYLFELQPGGQVEVRGPIGGHFIWDISMPGPLILIGGGSGMVPLMSMLRHHINHLADEKSREVIFFISARTIDHVLYKDELERIQKKNPNIKVIITLTDKQPADWKGYSRRIDREMTAEVVRGMGKKMPMMYVCGPTTFVEAVASHLVNLGFNSHMIRTERFG